MENVKAIPMFDNIFCTYIDNVEYGDLMELMGGPLYTISWLFSPLLFKYKDIEYRLPEELKENSTLKSFKQLSQYNNDPSLYSPDYEYWFKALLDRNDIV